MPVQDFCQKMVWRKGVPHFHKMDHIRPLCTIRCLQQFSFFQFDQNSCCIIIKRGCNNQNYGLYYLLVPNTVYLNIFMRKVLPFSYDCNLKNNLNYGKSKLFR